MGDHIEILFYYLEEGESFQHNDNRGIVTRCRECAYAVPSAALGHLDCERTGETVKPEDYCSQAKRG